MRQNDYERVQGIISMEEYLRKRQEERKTEYSKKSKKTRTAEWNTALEVATLYM